jgi:hypothetical protein
VNNGFVGNVRKRQLLYFFVLSYLIMFGSIFTFI